MVQSAYRRAQVAAAVKSGKQVKEAPNPKAYPVDGKKGKSSKGKK